VLAAAMGQWHSMISSGLRLLLTMLGACTVVARTHAWYSALAVKVNVSSIVN
jgi:hypothetical protein